MGGVNLVAGFRPELWREVAPRRRAGRVEGFDGDLVGADGFTMPATQHDAVLWLSGSAYDVVFECAREAIAELEGGHVVEETSSWPYLHDRDLTGFIDGTENPTLIDAPESRSSRREPGAGGTILLLQKWATTRGLGGAPVDRAGGGDRPAEDGQRRARGQARRLPCRGAPTRIDFGKIFRRNMPYGTVTDHGTMFVGFSADSDARSDAREHGRAGDGARDALTRYTRRSPARTTSCLRRRRCAGSSRTRTPRDNSVRWPARSPARAAPSRKSRISTWIAPATGSRPSAPITPAISAPIRPRSARPAARAAPSARRRGAAERGSRAAGRG